MASPDVQPADLSGLSLPFYTPVAVRLVEFCTARDDIALLRLIGFEPAMALAVLAAANEQQSTGTLDEAVDLLGADALRAIILSSCCVAPAVPPSIDMNACWQHAVVCRLLAQELAAHAGQTCVNQAALSGLIHDIGKLIPTAMYPESERRSTEALDHTVAGRLLLEQNRLPAQMVEAVRLHHQPPPVTASLDLIGCVALANKMAHMPPFGSLDDPEGLSGCLALFGLGEEDVNDLMVWTQTALSELMESLPGDKEALEAWPSMQQRASRLLRRQIADMGAGKVRGQQRVDALGGVHQAMRQLIRPVSPEDILARTALAAAEGLQVSSVEYVYHPPEGEALKSTKEIPAAPSVSAVIDAGEWGQGRLIAVYADKRTASDAGEWLKHYADLAGMTIAGFQRADHHRALADRFMQHQAAEITKPEQTAGDMEAGLRDLNAMAAQIAHIFNNLLAGILGHTQLLLKRQDHADKTVTGLQAIERAVLKGTQIIQHLQLASQTEPQQLNQTVGLNLLIEEALEELKSTLETADINVTTDLQAVGSEIAGRPDELRLMICQLVLNAVDAMPDGGDLRIETSQKNDLVICTTGDTGPGIDPDLHADIFKPLFTTRGAQSAGLGLSLARSIMLRHRGTIDIDSGVGRGTTVTLRFPAGSTEDIEKEKTPAASNGHAET